jgi:SAM-dependent methyltransferase
MSFKKIREKYVSLFPLKYVEPRIYATNEFVKRSAVGIPEGSKVIDLGAGECQYKKYFEKCEYVSQDVCCYEGFNYPKLDIVSDITKIPVKDGTFDYALCTEVIEHVYDTRGMFKEISRILKPGGKVYMTVAANAPEHQIPHDYFRFTRYSARKLAEDYGFEVERLEPAGGYFNFASTVLMSFGMTPATRPIWYVLLPFSFIVSFVLNKLDFLDKEKHYTHHFFLVAKKKARR